MPCVSLHVHDVYIGEGYIPGVLADLHSLCAGMEKQRMHSYRLINWTSNIDEGCALSCYVVRYV